MIKTFFAILSPKGSLGALERVRFLSHEASRKGSGGSV